MTGNMAVNGQNFGLPDLSGLSDGERQQVIAVMQRAKEFEIQEERTMKRPLEGQLNKYTNVMKGWQHRWFVLDPESGVLEYFEKEEHKKQRARASIHLAGAVICPSDEDSQTFTVNAANSEIYRLRASDAKERQRWVDRLRATAQHHTASLAQINREVWNSPSPAAETLVRKRHTSSQDNLHHPGVTQIHRSQHKPPVQPTPTGTDLFADPRGHLHEAEDYTKSLSEKIEELPPSGQILNPLDKDLLLMKATSMATLQCLSQCLTILQKRRTAVESGYSLQNKPAIQSGDSPPESYRLPDSASPETEQGQASSPMGSLSSASSLPYFSPDQKPPERIDHEEEVEDEVEYRDTDLEGVEEHKSIILHLLSQLKLGMDLTKVVLPTFILERRSLLELFADCMAHPNIFLRIPDLPDPESRMLAVLQWYLTSFHAGRQGSVAKKPYNPIIGETFHCSWRLSPEEVQTSDPFGKVKSEASVQEPTERAEEELFGYGEDDLSGGDNSRTRADNSEPEADNQQLREDYSKSTEDVSEAQSNKTDKPLQLTYCAEQVSHHPPISAFYFECPEKQMCMNASIYTKSKFMGMSIGLVMVGKLTLSLLGHDEVYEFGLPSVYARSILTVPWVELGDKIQITCQKTNLMAAVTFHTKPFYGGKLHRVSAEVKDTVTGNVACKVQGEWNKSFEFVYSEDDSRQIDVSDLQVYRKRVLPLEKQGEFESRRLWKHVTNTLAVGDVNTATEHKKFLEDRQREGERFRRETGTQFPTKFFHKEEDGWVYNKLLQPGQTSPSL